MKKNFKIVENFKIFAPIALAVILVGVILMCTINLNIGLDFAGGAKIEVDLGESGYTEQDKTNATNKVLEVISENKFKTNSSVRWSGDSNSVMEIGLAYMYDDKEVDASNIDAQSDFLQKIEGEDGLTTKIEEALVELNSSFDIDSESIKVRIVNASTAQKLLKNAIWATLAAVVIMLIYIIFRFTLASGLAAILALCHDVLVMFALMAIFQVQINTTFIAAVITIIGYSINATIVIFDRIREVKARPSMQDATDEEIANTSIKDTLNRNIFTTITTLITIIALVVVCSIMGVTSMEEFALPIIFGLIAGSYSSIFLASSFWVYLRKLGAKIKKTDKAVKKA